MSKNKLINQVIIESAEEDRSFLLLEGDIFLEPADVYVFNFYANQHNAGELANKLKDNFQYGILPESSFYSSGNGIRVGKLQLTDSRLVLLVHTDHLEFESIPVEQYQQSIDAVFASLQALEAFGYHFESIALPVLLRNGIQAIHQEAIKVLIERATAWLKTSTNTKVIKYVLYQHDDAELWNDNLDKVLNRKVAHVNNESTIYRSNVLSLLQRFDQNIPYWNDTLLPIRNILQRKDFRPEVLAAFSRKLVEAFCHDLNRANKSSEKTLDGYLAFIRKNALLNEWDIQTLYQIRSFGNPSIHRPDPKNGPRSMGDKDLTILLVALHKLLSLVFEFVQTNYRFSFYLIDGSEKSEKG